MTAGMVAMKAIVLMIGISHISIASRADTHMGALLLLIAGGIAIGAYVALEEITK